MGFPIFYVLVDLAAGGGFGGASPPTIPFPQTHLSSGGGIHGKSRPYCSSTPVGFFGSDSGPKKEWEGPTTATVWGLLPLQVARESLMASGRPVQAKKNCPV